MRCLSSLMQKALSFDKVAIVFAKGNDYKIHFWNTSKDEIIKMMKNSDFKKNSGILSNYINFLNIHKNG